MEPIHSVPWLQLLPGQYWDVSCSSWSVLNAIRRKNEFCHIGRTLAFIWVHGHPLLCLVFMVLWKIWWSQLLKQRYINHLVCFKVLFLLVNSQQTTWKHRYTKLQKYIAYFICFTAAVFFVLSMKGCIFNFYVNDGQMIFVVFIQRILQCQL